MTDQVIIYNQVTEVVVTEVGTELLISEVGVQGETGLQGSTPIFSRQNEISPTVGLTRYYFEQDRVLASVRASLGIPATGSPVVIDVLVNGVSIGTVTILAGQNTKLQSFGNLISANDYVTISILSVGSTVSGSDLTVVLVVN